MGEHFTSQCHLNRRQGAKALGAFMLSGLMLVLAGPPFDIWPLVFIAWVPALLALFRIRQSGRLTVGWAFTCGFFPGLMLFTSLLLWLTQHHLRFWFIVTLACAYPFGLAGRGFRLGLRAGLSGSWLVVWIAGLWTAMEMILWTWLPLPYSAMGGGLWSVPLLIQSADLAGVFGLSFWIMLINASIAATWHWGWAACRGVWILAFIVSAAHLGYGTWCYKSYTQAPPEPTPLHAGLVQSAVRIEDKFKRKHIEATVQALIDQTQQLAIDRVEPLDLVVWPETSVPVYLRSDKEASLRNALIETCRNTGTPLLLGAWTRATAGSGQENATFLVTPPDSIHPIYRKRKLVPFFETTPFYQHLPQSWQRCLTRPLAEGDQAGLLTLSDTHTLGVLTCWETLLPASVYDLVQSGATSLVNLTNDEAGFKRMSSSYAVPLPLLVFRAVETRRDILRAGNYGYSLKIDAAGTLHHRLPFGQTSATTCLLHPFRKHTWFLRYRNWFIHGWVLVISILGGRLWWQARCGRAVSNT